jgi:hypothetical protein
MEACFSKLSAPRSNGGALRYAAKSLKAIFLAVFTLIGIIIHLWADFVKPNSEKPHGNFLYYFLIYGIKLGA